MPRFTAPIATRAEGGGPGGLQEAPGEHRGDQFADEHAKQDDGDDETAEGKARPALGRFSSPSSFGAAKAADGVGSATTSSHARSDSRSRRATRARCAILARIDRRRVRGLDYEHLHFDSGYEPHPDEPGRERWLAYAANRTAHAWVVRHAGGERPWLQVRRHEVKRPSHVGARTPD